MADLTPEQIQPTWNDGVPWCAETECCQYDGKRCRLLGLRPGRICEPAVQRLSEELIEARKALAALEATKP